MEYTVDVTEVRRIKETWVIRGIRSRDKVYKAVTELELNTPPNVQMIAQFLSDNPDVDFCVVDHRYKLKEKGENNDT